MENDPVATAGGSVVGLECVNLSTQTDRQFRRISWQTRKRLVRIPCVVVPRTMVNTVVLLVKALATLLRSIATAAMRSAPETSNSQTQSFNSQRGAHRASLHLPEGYCQLHFDLYVTEVAHSPELAFSGPDSLRDSRVPWLFSVLPFRLRSSAPTMHRTSAVGLCR